VSLHFDFDCHWAASTSVVGLCVWRVSCCHSFRRSRGTLLHAVSCTCQNWTSVVVASWQFSAMRSTRSFKYSTTHTFGKELKGKEMGSWFQSSSTYISTQYSRCSRFHVLRILFQAWSRSCTSDGAYWPPPTGTSPVSNRHCKRLSTTEYSILQRFLKWYHRGQLKADYECSDGVWRGQTSLWPKESAVPLRNGVGLFGRSCTFPQCQAVLLLQHYFVAIPFVQCLSRAVHVVAAQSRSMSTIEITVPLEFESTHKLCCAGRRGLQVQQPERWFYMWMWEIIWRLKWCRAVAPLRQHTALCRGRDVHGDGPVLHVEIVVDRI
jgi:hypothetical protein